MEHDNKIDFRYKTSGILIFLALISISSLIPNFFMPINNSSFGLSSVIYNNIYQSVNSSLYNAEIYKYQDAGESDYLSDEYFNFYLRTDKILNYPMTELYMKSHPNNFVGRTRNGEYIYYHSLDDARQSQGYDGVVSINKESPEPAEYGNTYLTNDMVFKNNYGKDFNFSTRDLNYKEGYTVITGTWNNQSMTVDVPEVNGLNEKQKLILNSLVSSIRQTYNTINQVDTGIQNIDFAYIIDLNSPALMERVEKWGFYDLFVPKTIFVFLVAWLLISLLGFTTRYEKSLKVGFYKAIRRFPLEIVLLLSGLWFIPLIIGLESRSFFMYTYSTLIYGIGQTLLIFFGGIAALYYMHGIKSLHYDGKGSFLIKNSVIIKSVGNIWNFVRNEIAGFTNNFEGTNKTTILVVYSALLFIGFIGVGIFVRQSTSGLVFFLWIILITGMFGFFKSYYDSVKEIEAAAKEIAAGNYTVNIDEKETKFITLAHNINTISSNLDLAVDNAIKSERMKTELITNVSHDLKTPLTSIINYSELIVESDVDESELRQYAKVINEKSHKLKSLIEGIFEVSKLSSNNIELDLENLDFGQLIEQVIGEWEDKLSEKNLSVNVNIPSEPVIINIDGVQTSRILENIFSNIYKYALEYTRVYVDLTDGDMVELVVKNISKYPLNITTAELMERFIRGDESRSTEGSGLGLSIADSLTSIQGGTFSINIDGDLFKVTIRFDK